MMTAGGIRVSFFRDVIPEKIHISSRCPTLHLYRQQGVDSATLTTKHMMLGAKSCGKIGEEMGLGVDLIRNTLYAPWSY